MEINTRKKIIQIEVSQKIQKEELFFLQSHYQIKTLSIGGNQVDEGEYEKKYVANRKPQVRTIYDQAVERSLACQGPSEKMTTWRGKKGLSHGGWECCKAD